MDCMNNVMNALAHELTPITNWAIDQTDQHKRGLETSLARSVSPLLLSRVVVVVTALTVAAVYMKACPLLALAAILVYGYALMDFAKLTRKAVEAAERCGSGDAGMLAFHASLGFNIGSSTLLNRFRHASWWPFAR